MVIRWGCVEVAHRAEILRLRAFGIAQILGHVDQENLAGQENQR